MFSVVLNIYSHGVKRWATIIDSPSRSGATRKAKTVLKNALIDPKEAIKSRVRLDNYEYWRVED